jgi:hypothetical protein
VNLSKAVHDDVTVHYSATDNACHLRASDGRCTIELSGDLTIPAGTTTAEVRLNVSYDKSTADYTIPVTLSNPTRASIADGTAVVTVRNSTPTGTPLCQAWDRTGAAGTGATAGVPARCIAETRSVTGGYVSTYGSSDNPEFAQAEAMLPSNSTGMSVGPLPFDYRIMVSTPTIFTVVKDYCDHFFTYSRVGSAGVTIRSATTNYTYYAENNTYASYDVALGWRLEMNLIEDLSSGDTTLIRLTGVRLTAPDGSRTDFGVAQAGHVGNTCWPT